MFRPQRRVLDTLLPLQVGIEIPFAEAALREKERYRHAFVLASSCHSEHLYAARALARSVSDAVRRPAAGLYVGALVRTWPYFGTLERLHGTLREALQGGPEGAVTRVVVASSRLRGFLFARTTPAGGLLYAMPFDLTYRRFVAGLSWEAWQEGVTAFLACLEMRRTSRDDAVRSLGRLVESLRELRIARPGLFPPALPVSDLERRFGRVAAALWREWAQGDAPEDEDVFPCAQAVAPALRPVPAKEANEPPLPTWRRVPEESLAREAATRSDEVESTRDALALPLCQLGFLVRETIFACVAKIAAGGELGCRLGLKDFRLEISFDNGPVLVRQVELAFPVYGRDAHAEAIVERLLENLPRGPAEIPAAAQEPGEQAPGEQAQSRTLFHIVNRVEGVSVVPTHVARKDEGFMPLFESDPWLARGLADAHERMRVKDKARPSTLAVSDNLAPLQALRECSVLQASGETAVFGEAGAGVDESARTMTRPLFRYAQGTRPLQILSSCPRFPRGQARGLSLRFLESVEGFDYFLGIGMAPNAFLWLRSSVEERAKTAQERELTLLGLFEEAAFRALPESRHVL